MEWGHKIEGQEFPVWSRQAKGEIKGCGRGEGLEEGAEDRETDRGLQETGQMEGKVLPR